MERVSRITHVLYVCSAALGGVLSTTVYNAPYNINSSHPFPRPKSFDFSQIQCQPNQLRETFHGTRADDQCPSGTESRARDLGARIWHSHCCVVRREPVGDAGPSLCRPAWRLLHSWPHTQEGESLKTHLGSDLENKSPARNPVLFSSSGTSDCQP